jgi:hypothetical protein
MVLGFQDHILGHSGSGVQTKVDELGYSSMAIGNGRVDLVPKIGC